jgi:hypothetical protein
MFSIFSKNLNEVKLYSVSSKSLAQFQIEGCNSGGGFSLIFGMKRRRECLCAELQMFAGTGSWACLDTSN